jgi:hypothetical protein
MEVGDNPNKMKHVLKLKHYHKGPPQKTDDATCKSLFYFFKHLQNEHCSVNVKTLIDEYRNLTGTNLGDKVIWLHLFCWLMSEKLVQSKSQMLPKTTSRTKKSYGFMWNMRTSKLYLEGIPLIKLSTLMKQTSIWTSLIILLYQFTYTGCHCVQNSLEDSSLQDNAFVFN